MEALFVILKAVGILLAVLLLLCIALIVVPVRYRVNIKVQDEVEGKAIIHWLFHLVDVRIYYREKKVLYKLRILGIALPLDKKKEGRKEDSGGIKKRKMEKNIPEKSVGFEESGQEGLNSQEKISAEKESSAKREISLEKGSSAKREISLEKESFAEKEIPAKRKEIQEKGILDGEEAISSERKKKIKRQGNKRIFSKFKTGINNSKQKFGTMGPNFRQRIEGIKNGTTTLQEQIENIKSMVSEEANQAAFFRILREARYLLRHYVPGTVSGNVTFSMGNPEQTGKALGAVSLLPFWARSRMVVMPDFLSESFYAKGILFAAGHIRFLHIPVSGIRLITDKNIRKLITNIRE